MPVQDPDITPKPGQILHARIWGRIAQLKQAACNQPLPVIDEAISSD